MCQCTECNEKIKRLEQALDICKLNRELAEKLSYDQSVYIGEMRKEIIAYERGRH